MSIQLKRRPSVDGIGVKRWTYPLNDVLTLHVFWRPEQYRSYEAHTSGMPYLLRVDHRDGRVMEVATAESEGMALAQIAKMQERAGKETWYT